MSGTTPPGKLNWAFPGCFKLLFKDQFKINIHNTKTANQMSNTINLTQEQERIFSIDFFRGFTMFMLVGGLNDIFGKLDPVSSGPVVNFFQQQLHHVQWEGLHFWDLIQPFFMFIVGVAMPFSFSRRWQRGDSWRKTFYHVITRCFFLLLIGWAISSSATTSNFNNVIAQLSVTYLIAFLIMRKHIKWQLIVSFALIIVSDMLYRLWPVEGFNQPFVAGQNFGSWTDMMLTGSLEHRNWVPFNAIPTSAHTIWGVIVGTILMKDWSPRKKIMTLMIAGTIGVIVGYLMNPFIPIIKHICTSSFIIVSGGWCLIGMALSYWLFDVLNFRKVPMFFAVFGMNPLFLYLMAESFRNFFSTLVNPFVYRIFSWTNEVTLTVISTSIIAAMLWYVCYFLYKRRIFIRL
jgi:predicted acyltransferase